MSSSTLQGAEVIDLAHRRAIAVSPNQARPSSLCPRTSAEETLMAVIHFIDDEGQSQRMSVSSTLGLASVALRDSELSLAARSAAERIVRALGGQVTAIVGIKLSCLEIGYA